MLQIYNQSTVPSAVKKKCEQGIERGGIRYTCYLSDPKNSNTSNVREVLFYIAYSELDLETMLSVVKTLEFEKNTFIYSGRIGNYQSEKLKKPWINKFKPLKLLKWFFFGGLFAVIVLKISIEIIKKIFVYLY